MGRPLDFAEKKVSQTIVWEVAVFEWAKQEAKKEGLSLSMFVSNLVKGVKQQQESQE